MRAIGNETRNFESRSSEKDDTSADTYPSPSNHINGRRFNLDKFNMHPAPLHDGASVAPGLEHATLHHAREFLTITTRLP
ncbi:hypothetical protein TNCV_2415361 [Trichonephila clavipes]|nr:hypothetical protein TNCV_2415361 [Trichonephila clavipes]